MSLIFKSDVKYNNPPMLILIIILWFFDLIAIIGSPTAIFLEVFFEKNYIILFTIPIFAFAVFLIHGKIVSWLPDNFEIHDDKVVVYNNRFFMPWKSNSYEVEIKEIEYGVIYPQTLFLRTTRGICEAGIARYDKDHIKKINEANRILKAKGIRFISKEEYKEVSTREFRENIRINAEKRRMEKEKKKLDKNR